jgi:hypothetical protein
LARGWEPVTSETRLRPSVSLEIERGVGPPKVLETTHRIAILLSLVECPLVVQVVIQGLVQKLLCRCYLTVRSPIDVTYWSLHTEGLIVFDHSSLVVEGRRSCSIEVIEPLRICIERHEVV